MINPRCVGAPIDLWDQNWPSSGYYWTVVPVATSAAVRDMELAAGRVRGGSCPAVRDLEPAVADTGSRSAVREWSLRDWAARLRMHTAKFYGQPLVAWTPAVNATAYELQWSKKRYPFNAPRHPPHPRDLARLEPQAGHVVLPRAGLRLQPADRRAGDGVVVPTEDRRRRAEAHHRSSREHRSFVDRIRREALELVREDVARSRRVAGRERHRLAVERDAGRASPRRRARARCRDGRAASGASRRAATPAPRSRSRARCRRPRFPATASRGASASATSAPTRCPTPRSGGRARASRVYACGRSSHSVESTMSRSVTSTSCSSSARRHGGSPRQRRKTGRSEMRSGWTMLAGAFARSPRSVSSTTSVTMPRSVPGTSQRSTEARASIRLSSAFGSGKRRIVRDGCRSAIPSSAARACSRQPCGTHAMCVITDVRICGASPAASLRSRASAASTSARRTPSACQRSSLSAVATSGRRGGGGRPEPGGPHEPGGVVRERRACRAPSRRRSRRRASTAPRPRRRA